MTRNPSPRVTNARIQQNRGGPESATGIQLVLGLAALLLIQDSQVVYQVELS